MKRLGFLTKGTSIGILVGYIMADIYCQAYGMLLFTGTFQRERKIASILLLVPPAIGFSVGIAFDLFSTNPERRKKFDRYMGRLLELTIVILILYFVAAGIMGNMTQAARE